MRMIRRHKLGLAVKGACVLVLLAGLASSSLAIEDKACLQCHGDRDLKRKLSDGMKSCLFLDHKKFKVSVHGAYDVSCTDCHADIKKLNPDAKGKDVPHAVKLEPVKCLDCHSDEHASFVKSVHYKIRRKGISLSCYSCHKYHQVKYISGYSAVERKNAFCVKCHTPEKSHNWLPQKKRHFSRVDCSVCHAPKAKRYVNLRIFDKTRNAFPTGKEILASLKTKQDEFMAVADLDKDEQINAAELEKMFGVLRKDNLSPVLRGELLAELNPVVHEINVENAVRDCTKCHTPGAPYYQNTSLSLLGDDNATECYAVSGEVLGSFRLLPDFYAMSATRTRVVDYYGLLLILVTVSAVSLHFLVRVATVFQRRRKQREAPGPEQTGAVLMHTAATRVWHWTRSVSIIALLLTGAQIRYNDKWSFMLLSDAVSLHRIASILLIAAFVLWLAYSLTRGKIRDYFAHPLSFIKSGAGQAIFYLTGYFGGKPDPHHPTPENKFNTLQKMAYGATMFLVLPAQMVTGLLLSDIEEYGNGIDMLGGVKMVGTAHAALFFLVIAFLLVHLYMSTMGKTPLQHIRTMITGHRDSSPIDTGQTE